MSDKTGGNVNEPETLGELMARQDPAKMQALSANMSAALIESQKLMADLFGQVPGSATKPQDHPLAIGSGDAMARLGQSLATRPDRMVDANMALMQGYMELWQAMLLGETGERGRDRRFSDPEWSANPVFDFMRRAYKLNTDWLMSLVDGAEDLAEQDRRKAKFLARQTIDAFAPTNFFATNPAALKVMIESGGESVVEGLKQARADIARGGGKLSISQTDETPFRVGENVATAPGKVVFRNELIELIQYAPTTEQVHEVPLLIYPPWINKFYILDLREENSMIRWLVDRGLTVFVVSWRSADDEIKDFTWDDYAQKGIFAGLEEALKASGAKQVNTVGYCIGGTLLSSVLGYMARTGDERIRSATFFASQSDFERGGDLLVFTDPHAIEEVSRLIDENGGYMPGETMGETFNWLRPVDLVWRYVVDNYMMGKKPRPFDLLYWNADQTNIPGPTHLTYLRDLYGHNALSRGQFKVLGETVDLNDVTIPITVQCSRDDHICPFESVYNTAKAFGGPARFVLAGSGHIAGVVNHPDSGKYQHWLNDGDLPGSVEAWMDGASEQPGSWWPSWWNWLAPLSGRKVAAREPADQGLGDAPGFYVTCRLADIAEARKKGTVPRPPQRGAVKSSRPERSAATRARRPARERLETASEAAAAAPKQTRKSPKAKRTASKPKAAASKKAPARTPARGSTKKTPARRTSSETGTSGTTKKTGTKAKSRTGATKKKS